MVMKFQTATIVATPGVIEAAMRLTTALDPTAVLLPFLFQFLSGDWGELYSDDKILIELALVLGNRLHGIYRLPDGTVIWIMTEADRSATTILLPEEY